MNRSTFWLIPMALVLLTLSLACSGSGNGGGNSRQVDDDTISDDDVSPTDDDSAPDDDANDDDTVELTWVSIPAGTFWMGCVPQDPDCLGDDLPRHQVTLPAFEITKSDITQGQYQAVTGNNPSYFTSCGADCPVEEVSWFDADSFCQKIGGRLATEAEWEYAARAGTDTIYICGDDRSCLDSIAWYWNNSGETTHPVCQKTPNAWGLCDMTGNVWQWVNDWYNESYYPISPVNDPPGPATGSERVLRGGSWQYSPRFARPSVRFKFNPDYRLNYLGFRCTRD